MLTELISLRKWRKRAYSTPVPAIIKRSCLLRNGISGATWVETGTFKGGTTEVLARLGGNVHSIEPSPKFYRRAVKKFRATPNVTLHHGTSETVFPELLASLSGSINFWLDGHYSAGETFQAESDTPILLELETIKRNFGNFETMSVMVDDVRAFDPTLPGCADYPPKRFLVDWAENLGLNWHIEHDIFVARSRGV